MNQKQEGVSPYTEKSRLQDEPQLGPPDPGIFWHRAAKESDDPAVIRRLAQADFEADLAEERARAKDVIAVSRTRAVSRTIAKQAIIDTQDL